MLTCAECGAGKAKLSDTRKPDTEVTPGTTTPTRHRAVLPRLSEPHATALPQASPAADPAWPTTPRNPCAPPPSLVLAYQAPNTLFPFCACAQTWDTAVVYFVCCDKGQLRCRIVERPRGCIGIICFCGIFMGSGGVACGNCKWECGGWAPG